MWLVWTGRIVAMLWGGWWTFFGVACGLGEGIGFGGTLMHALLPGGLFLAMALVSFRWVTAGGYALLGTGIVVLVGYPLMAYGKFSVTTIITVLLMIALPPLLAGAGILYGNSPRAAEPPPDRR